MCTQCDDSLLQTTRAIEAAWAAHATRKAALHPESTPYGARKLFAERGVLQALAAARRGDTVTCPAMIKLYNARRLAKNYAPCSFSADINGAVEIYLETHDRLGQLVTQSVE